MMSFNFGNLIKVFEGKGLNSTFSEFINSEEAESSILELSMNHIFSEWERIDIYLDDKRIIKNAFLYLGKYVFWMGYIANKGDVARFSVEEIVFFADIYSEYKFSKSNILCVKINNKQERNKRFVFFPLKRPLNKELLTTIKYWNKLPENCICKKEE
ncbi:hypothetical protein L3073_00085 [Ancylomarina sp. DW003]|nr:hypothetical protein [Ancylomarina sp. DW003]MDE5420600.1 hypothetical protein [Ancylomarina sp. DW003]